MTIGWAIVAVAILYLLDKYGVLKKCFSTARVTIVIATCMIIVGLSVVYGLSRWKAKTYERTDSTANASLPSDRSGINNVPTTTGYEFPFRRVGSAEYTKAVCFNEATGKATPQPFTNTKNSCSAGSILMEEVK